MQRIIDAELLDSGRPLPAAGLRGLVAPAPPSLLGLKILGGLGLVLLGAGLGAGITAALTPVSPAPGPPAPPAPPSPTPASGAPPAPGSDPSTWNPPLPPGWQMMADASVTPDMKQWALTIWKDPVSSPMFSTTQLSFNGVPTLARVEWHPPHAGMTSGVLSTIHRGVTLYQRAGS
jgi:hypothetical protein